MTALPPLEEFTDDLLESLTPYERFHTLAWYDRVREHPDDYAWKTKVQRPTPLHFARFAYSTARWDIVRRVWFFLLAPGTALCTLGFLGVSVWLIAVGVPLFVAAVVLLGLLLARKTRIDGYFDDRLGDGHSEK